jgi:hypothetical protein
MVVTQLQKQSTVFDLNGNPVACREGAKQCAEAMTGTKWQKQHSGPCPPTEGHSADLLLQALVDKLHDAGQHWIPIVDPGIKVEAGDAAYDDGIALDIFLKDSIGNPYVGQVLNNAIGNGMA